MKIEFREQISGKIYSICPLKSHPHRDFITVYIYNKMEVIGQEARTEISWSSLGSVTVEEAKEFAAGLAKAIAIAENEEHKIGYVCLSCGRDYPNQAICDSDECPANVSSKS